MIGVKVSGLSFYLILETSHLYAQLNSPKLQNYNHYLRKRNAKILTLSADSVEDHLEWVEVINNYKNKTTTTDDLKNLLLGIDGDTDVNFPIISDPDLEVATLYGMYHPKALPNAGSFGGENNQPSEQSL